MRQRVAKKLRREVRAEVRRKWATDLDFLQSLPFGARLKIALQVLLKTG